MPGDRPSATRGLYLQGSACCSEARVLFKCFPFGECGNPATLVVWRFQRKEMYDMANSNRKKARKLQAAKKANAAEREKAAKKVKPAEEKPIKYTITAEQQADGTFEFHGGKGGFNIIKQKNKVLEPYGKHYVILVLAV